MTLAKVNFPLKASQQQAAKESGCVFENRDAKSCSPPGYCGQYWDLHVGRTQMCFYVAQLPNGS